MYDEQPIDCRAASIVLSRCLYQLQLTTHDLPSSLGPSVSTTVPPSTNINSSTLSVACSTRIQVFKLPLPVLSSQIRIRR